MKAAEHAPDEVWIDYLDIDSVQFAEQNPKGHDRPGINESYSRHGAVMPPALNEGTGRLFAGHGRIETLRERKGRGDPPPKRVRVDAEGRWLLPVLRGIDFPTDAAALEYLLIDNKLTEAGGWVRGAYEEIVDALEKRGANLEAVGWKRQELDDIAAEIEARHGGAPPAPTPSLRDRFLVPPFSILDARQGYWKARKAEWLAIGIRSEVGRGDNLIGRSLYDIAAAGMPGTYDEKKRFIDGLKAQGKSDEEIVAAIAEAGGRSRPAFPKTGAVVPPGQGGGNMVEQLLSKRAAEKRSKRQGTNRAPMAASFGQDLMRGKGEIPADGLGPGQRKADAIPGGAGKNAAWRKGGARARTFDTGAQLGGGNFNDQVVGKRGRDGTKAIGTQGWVQDKIAEGDIAGGMASGQSGTSIFDPVLCELAYRWFAPQGGLVLDPFAGGSVRGVVASLLGLRYVGIDLRGEQVEANREQGAKLCAKAKHRPKWVIGDSRDLAELVPAKARSADLIFSCPPYADLERYSDDVRDLSTMAYVDFLAAYRLIIAAAVASLKADRFACFVVGDVRGPSGAYRDFPGDTVQAFRDAGAELYNDAILVTAIGSLPIRVGKQFVTTRKLGKTHQQVYVFCKGDARRATEACGKIEIEFPADLIVASEAPAAGKYGEEMP
jgi:hypothetical protein